MRTRTRSVFSSLFFSLVLLALGAGLVFFLPGIGWVIGAGVILWALCRSI